MYCGGGCFHSYIVLKFSYSDLELGIMRFPIFTSSSMRCSVEYLSGLILLHWYLPFKGEIPKCFSAYHSVSDMVAGGSEKAIYRGTDQKDRV